MESRAHRKRIAWYANPLSLSRIQGKMNGVRIDTNRVLFRWQSGRYDHRTLTGGGEYLSVRLALVGELLF